MTATGVTGAAGTLPAARRRALIPASALRSALAGVTGVLVVAIGAGALPWLTGTDPARSVLRARHVEGDPDQAALDAVRAELGLASNPFAGAWDWLAGLLHGDLGTSWVSGAAVAPRVGSALLVSLNLAGVAALVALLLAVLLVTPRVIAVGRGGQAASRPVHALIAALAAVPEFVLAVLLAAIFAVRLRWLPATGWTEPRDMILPVTAIAISATGILARVLLTAIIAVASEDWVHTWRANGARPWRISAEVARRAVAVTLPQVLLLFAGLVGASVVIEDTYAIPGLGRLALNAALAQDIPLVQGAVAALVVLGVAVGAAGALLHRLLLAPALGEGRGAGVVRRVARFLPTPAWRVATVLLALLVLGGIPRSAAISPAERYLAPSWVHPLGTDNAGRDVWARVGDGALLTIGLAAAVSLVCLIVGLAVGLLARDTSAGLTDALNAVPSTFLGLVVAAVLEPGLGSAALAVCLVGWIPLAVHTRTLAAEARACGFYQAAIVSGAGRWRLIRRHLLPSVIRPVSGHAIIRLPHLALALTALGFLGLGAGHDSPEWGKLLSDSVAHLERAPWVVAAPAIGLVLVGLVANLAYDS